MRDLDKLIKDLQVFIEYSFLQGGDLPAPGVFIQSDDEVTIHCWEQTDCDKTECPAYGNTDRRCWLLAGTMCGGCAQGRLIEKFGSCTKCNVYLKSIGNNKVKQLRELITALIYAIRLRQKEPVPPLSDNDNEDLQFLPPDESPPEGR